MPKQKTPPKRGLLVIVWLFYSHPWLFLVRLAFSVIALRRKRPAQRQFVFLGHLCVPFCASIWHLRLHPRLHPWVESGLFEPKADLSLTCPPDLSLTGPRMGHLISHFISHLISHLRTSSFHGVVASGLLAAAMFYHTHFYPLRNSPFYRGQSFPQ